MELFILVVLYMLPWICALCRSSTRTAGVFFMNLLLGWTGIFWLFALIWAFGSDRA